MCCEQTYRVRGQISTVAVKIRSGVRCSLGRQVSRKVVNVLQSVVNGPQRKLWRQSALVHCRCARPPPATSNLPTLSIEIRDRRPPWKPSGRVGSASGSVLNARRLLDVSHVDKAARRTYFNTKTTSQSDAMFNQAWSQLTPRTVTLLWILWTSSSRSDEILE